MKGGNPLSKIYHGIEVLSIAKTSSEVKNRYAAKVYSKVQINLKKELVAAWDELLKQTGETRAGFIRKAIEKELEK